MRLRLRGNGGRLLHIKGTIKLKTYTIRNSNNDVLLQVPKSIRTIELPDNAKWLTTQGVNVKVHTEAAHLSPVMGMYDNLLEYREQHSTRDLRFSWRYSKSAQQHSEYMRDYDVFEHSYFAGRQYGENIAAGYDGYEAAMKAFESSPPHNANLLNPGYREIGIGYAASSLGTTQYTYYWTQQFV